MEFFNTLSGLNVAEERSPEKASVMCCAVESLTLLLSPIVPHIAEECGRRSAIRRASCWRLAGLAGGCHRARGHLVVIQVNGKLRSRMTVAVDAADGRGQLEGAGG
jgi:leucyl-tRNA synthetase